MERHVVNRLIIALLVAILPSPLLAEGRDVILGFDRSKSVSPQDQTNAFITAKEQVVPNLGGGDVFACVDLGVFKPNITFRERFPDIAPGLITSTESETNYFKWLKSNAELTEIRKAIGAKRGHCIRWLDEQSKLEGTDRITDVWTTLAFLSSLVQASPRREHWIYVWSDLINDTGHGKSYLPPNTIADFRNCHVILLGVYFDNFGQWNKSKTAWENWFRRAGAIDVKVFNSASSEMVEELLPKNPVEDKVDVMRTSNGN